MAKKSKYDTNPLDPDVVRRTDDVWGAQRSSEQQTEALSGATREVEQTASERASSHAGADAPTRRYYEPPQSQSNSYPSVFIPPTNQPPAPQAYTAAGAHLLGKQQPTSRTVPGIGLPENLALVLPYLPFYIGAVCSVIELFLIPRKEIRVRFHAAQGLALHLGVLGIQFLFNIVGWVTGSTFGSTLFRLAALVFFVISIIRVSRGEEHHVAPVADLTRWFNERIEPRK